MGTVPPTQPVPMPPRPVGAYRVTTNAGVRLFRADRTVVKEGALLLYLNDRLVASFPSGTWQGVVLAGPAEQKASRER